MAESEPQFLARQSFRRRRLGDVAMLVPVFGLVLMLVPILWADDYETSGAMVYIFIVWAILICGVGLLSRALAKVPSETGATDDAATPER